MKDKISISKQGGKSRKGLLLTILKEKYRFCIIGIVKT
jgi:hypothetical protein